MKDGAFLLQTDKIFFVHHVKSGYNADCGCTVSQLREIRKMQKIMREVTVK